MIRQEYLDYIAGFSNLNPYELEHMSEKIYVQMERILYDNENSKNQEVQFSVPELKSIITTAMRQIYLELANIKKMEFDAQLQKIKSMTFNPEGITLEDIESHKSKVSNLYGKTKPPR